MGLATEHDRGAGLITLRGANRGFHVCVSTRDGSVREYTVSPPQHSMTPFPSASIILIVDPPNILGSCSAVCLSLGSPTLRRLYAKPTSVLATVFSLATDQTLSEPSIVGSP